MKQILIIIVLFSFIMPVHSMDKNKIEQEKKEASIVISKQAIDDHKGKFTSHVKSLKRQVSWTPNWVISRGAKLQGYDDYTIKCIPVSYTFFALKNDDIVTILQAVGTKDDHCKYLNDVLKRYNETIKEHKGGKHCKNSLARILHEKHVSSVTLPEGVNIQSLIDDPGKYQALLKQNKINLDQYTEIVSLNLFAQFWQEKVVKVLK